MKEVWKDIPGYEEFYQASTLGRIRSLTRFCKTKGGALAQRFGKILKAGQSLERDGGHLRVVLCKDGKKKNIGVHRLVLLTFIGPCPDGMQACHFPDRNVLNNRIKNLMWGTPKLNSEHSKIHGTHTSFPGSKNPAAKLVLEDIREIRRMRKTGMTYTSIAKKFKVTVPHVWRIVHYEVWSSED